jgi:hypothetical protein
MATNGKQSDPNEDRDWRSREDLLAAGIAAGQTIEAAARAAGMGARTAYRKSKEEGIRRRVAEMRTAIVERAVGLASEGLLDGVVQLRLLCRNSTSEGIRLSAARSLVECALNIRTHLDHEQRLSALESKANERKPAKKEGK